MNYWLRVVLVGASSTVSFSSFCSELTGPSEINTKSLVAARIVIENNSVDFTNKKKHLVENYLRHAPHKLCVYNSEGVIIVSSPFHIGLRCLMLAYGNPGRATYSERITSYRDLKNYKEFSHINFPDESDLSFKDESKPEASEGDSKVIKFIKSPLSLLFPYCFNQ